MHKGLVLGLLCFFIVCPFLWSISSVALGVSERNEGDENERVYLVHTDVLYKTRNDVKAEILVGNVQLAHKGAVLYCDSARFYREDNSFDAFGRVKMEQGDTLKLFGDSLYYKGNEMVAHAIGNVKLYHKESRLETTYLDYFRKENLGVYHDGGTLYDKENVLYSDWGQYSPPLNEAMFVDGVILTNPKFVMKTNMLYYYTDTEINKIY